MGGLVNCGIGRRFYSPMVVLSVVVTSHKAQRPGCIASSGGELIPGSLVLVVRNSRRSVFDRHWMRRTGVASRSAMPAGHSNLRSSPSQPSTTPYSTRTTIAFEFFCTVAILLWAAARCFMAAHTGRFCSYSTYLVLFLMRTTSQLRADLLQTRCSF